MAINGYSYSPKYGAILNADGKAVADQHSHIGGAEWDALQKAAWVYFYEAIKSSDGFAEYEVPKIELPDGMYVEWSIGDEDTVITISSNGLDKGEN